MLGVWWRVAVPLGWIAMGLLGAVVARRRRRPVAEGGALGMLFGPFGVLAEGCLPKGEPGRKVDPFDGESPGCIVALVAVLAFAIYATVTARYD